MKKKSIAKNYVYNLIYQLLTIFLPLITTPYLSRILGAEQIGIYGYTTSIVTYFILFGSLGTSMYGQREIAYHQNNEKKKSKVFFEIVIIRFVSLSISLLLFYFIYARVGDYSLYYKILLIQLAANIFDISWLFQGIEEFDKTVVRNLIVKLLCLILIFVVVKDYDDLWLYFLIYAFSELIGNLSIWLYVPKYIKKVKISELNFKRHIKQMFSLLIPQIAIQIYTVFDKTMIGLITEDMTEVGYYEQAQKIVKAALMIVNALQIVMNSRIANAYAARDDQEVRDCLEKSFNFMWLLSIPMMFGLIAVAPNFVPWYYGKGYNNVINILIATAPILVAIGLNGITGIQYLVQIGKEKIFTKSVIIGSIVNVVFNFVLIKYYGGMGAAISSVISEMCIFLFQLKYFKKQFSIVRIFKLSLKCFISGIVMFLAIKFVSNYLSVSIINTLIQVLVGIVVYFVCLLLLKYQFLKDLVSQILNGIKEKLKRGGFNAES